MNDSKYGRLYPERAVAPLRDLYQRLMKTAPGGAALVEMAEAIHNLDDLGFPEDEPLFLLRGQDELATCAVKHYAEDIRLSKIPEPTRTAFHAHVIAFADRMERWQPRKLPD